MAYATDLWVDRSYFSFDNKRPAQDSNLCKPRPSHLEYIFAFPSKLLCLIWKLLEPSRDPRPLSHLKNVRCSCLPQDSRERHRNESHEQSSLSQWPSDHKSMCILGIQILAIWTSEENPRTLAGQAKQSKLFKLFKLFRCETGLDCIVNIRKASHVVGGFNPSQQNGKKLGKLPTADYYVFHCFSTVVCILFLESPFAAHGGTKARNRVRLGRSGWDAGGISGTTNRRGPLHRTKWWRTATLPSPVETNQSHRHPKGGPNRGVWHPRWWQPIETGAQMLLLQLWGGTCFLGSANTIWRAWWRRQCQLRWKQVFAPKHRRSSLQPSKPNKLSPVFRTLLQLQVSSVQPDLAQWQLLQGTRSCGKEEWHCWHLPWPCGVKWSAPLGRISQNAPRFHPLLLCRICTRFWQLHRRTSGRTSTSHRCQDVDDRWCSRNIGIFGWKTAWTVPPEPGCRPSRPAKDTEEEISWQLPKAQGIKMTRSFVHNLDFQYPCRAH